MVSVLVFHHSQSQVSKNILCTGVVKCHSNVTSSYSWSAHSLSASLIHFLVKCQMTSKVGSGRWCYLFLNFLFDTHFFHFIILAKMNLFVKPQNSSDELFLYQVLKFRNHKVLFLSGASFAHYFPFYYSL